MATGKTHDGHALGHLRPLLLSGVGLLLFLSLRHLASAAPASALPVLLLREAVAIRSGAPLLQRIASATAFPFEIENGPLVDDERGSLATLNVISERYFTVMESSAQCRTASADG